MDYTPLSPDLSYLILYLQCDLLLPLLFLENKYDINTELMHMRREHFERFFVEGREV